jgi:hypothetical protein
MCLDFQELFIDYHHLLHENDTDRSLAEEKQVTLRSNRKMLGSGQIGLDLVGSDLVGSPQKHCWHESGQILL